MRTWRSHSRCQPFSQASSQGNEELVFLYSRFHRPPLFAIPVFIKLIVLTSTRLVTVPQMPRAIIYCVVSNDHQRPCRSRRASLNSGKRCYKSHTLAHQFKFIRKFTTPTHTCTQTHHTTIHLITIDISTIKTATKGDNDKLFFNFFFRFTFCFLFFWVGTNDLHLRSLNMDGKMLPTCCSSAFRPSN